MSKIVLKIELNDAERDGSECVDILCNIVDSESDYEKDLPSNTALTQAEVMATSIMGMVRDEKQINSLIETFLKSLEESANVSGATEEQATSE